MENSNGGNTNVGSIGNSIKNERSSIEEDIKILEELRIANENCIKNAKNKDNPFVTIWGKQNRALEHILSDYKKLQEEFREVDHECDRLEKIDFEKDMKIKELQKENEELKNQEETARKVNELLVERYSTSIPVQKVKDKIEELKSNPLKIKQNDKYYFETHAYNKIIISVLQELLESEE